LGLSWVCHVTTLFLSLLSLTLAYARSEPTDVYWYMRCDSDQAFSDSKMASARSGDAGEGRLLPYVPYDAITAGN